MRPMAVKILAVYKEKGHKIGEGLTKGLLYGVLAKDVSFRGDEFEKTLEWMVKNSYLNLPQNRNDFFLLTSKGFEHL
jgi:hypothetical protein